MKIVFIGGYSRSGKSSTMNLLSRAGYTCASTSQYLTNVSAYVTTKVGTTAAEARSTQEYAALVEQYMLNRPEPTPLELTIREALTSKHDDLLLTMTLKTCRDFKIHIAEEVIVPNFGRTQGMIVPACEAVPPETPLVFFETIGGIEWKQARSWFDLKGGNQTDMVNIRAAQELQGVDIRELLPTDNMINFNPDEFYDEDELDRIAYQSEYLADIASRFGDPNR